MVKNNKKYYTPYKKLNNNHVIIMWDYQPIIKEDNNGNLIETNLATWEEYNFEHKPTQIEIEEIILNYYNNKINDKILNGFMWKDMNVWLSIENQINYKKMYDLVKETNGSILPIKFKFSKDGVPMYHVFTTIDELADFYHSSSFFIQKTLEEGWEIKEKFNWGDYIDNI
jgi:hypothetical protein